MDFEHTALHLDRRHTNKPTGRHMETKIVRGHKMRLFTLLRAHPREETFMEISLEVKNVVSTIFCPQCSAQSHLREAVQSCHSFPKLLTLNLCFGETVHLSHAYLSPSTTGTTPRRPAQTPAHTTYPCK